MSGRSKMPERTVGLHFDWLPGLSRSASRFARQHPREARIAVAAALEAAAVQFEAESAGANLNVPEALERFVVRKRLGSDMIGVSEAAARLDVSRTTVYDWIRKKMLVAWTTTRRGLVIPAEQILGPGRVVPGLFEVLGIIEDPDLAWTFLSEEWPFEDEAARPIDKLKGGKLEDVVSAAPSFGTAVT